MNSDPLGDLWNCPDNQPDAEAGPRLASRFVTRMRKRRRFQAWWLGWTLLALTLVSGLALFDLVRNGPGDASQAGTLGLLLGLLWFVTLRFVRTFFSQGQSATQSVLPLRDALIAARASNVAESRHLRTVGWLFVAMTPVLALAIRQLHIAGKASTDEAWSMALVFGLALALGAAGMLARYRFWLLPETQWINALLCDPGLADEK